MGNGSILKPGTVGIVGLGDQGTPIALCVLKAGWRLAFHARRQEVRDRFVAEGATALSLCDLGAASDILLVVVGDEHDMRCVVVESGLLAAMRPGSILVIHSSVPPAAIRALGRQAEPCGIHLIDAPVSGGRARSYAGDLVTLAGGDADAINTARPVMSAYSSTIARVGPLGSGQLMKSLNNYLYAAHLATAAKAVELIDALGLDPKVAAEVLPLCSGSSTAFAIQAARAFAATEHDKGGDRAAELLGEVVQILQTSARQAAVDIKLIDALVEDGLRALRSSREPGRM
jgi:3-hydroxyisobutyrate dehydrogenase